MRQLLFCLACSALLAQEPVSQVPESLQRDSSTTAQLADSTAQPKLKVTSAWIVPVAIVCVTAGVFIFLFTARSK